MNDQNMECGGKPKRDAAFKRNQALNYHKQGALFQSSASLRRRLRRLQQLGFGRNLLQREAVQFQDFMP